MVTQHEKLKGDGQDIRLDHYCWMHVIIQCRKYMETRSGGEHLGPRGIRMGRGQASE
jgi:hypothetical protein